MSISHINNAGGAADRTIEFAFPKPVSEDFADSTEKRLDDSAKFDNEIAEVDHQVTADFLQETIDNVNKQLSCINREINYSIHEKTGQFIVKIIDKETQEVIREIPPERNLDIVAKLCELAGLFVDEKK